MTDLVPTSGKTWRKPREEGIAVRLPSGNTVRIRPVGVDLFIKVGYIPDFLTPGMIDLATKGRGVFPAATTREEVAEYNAFLDSLCQIAFVSPRIVETPQAEDEIGIEDVEAADKDAVFKILGKPARALAGFPANQENDLGVVPTPAADGNTDQPHPENTAVVQSDDGDAGHVDGDHAGSGN